MKKIITQIIAVFIGSVVLLGSFGFTVSTHLCGGEKVKAAVGFVKSDLTCGMKKVESKCPNKSHLKKVCCENVFDYHHLEDDIQKNITEYFIPVFVVVNYNVVLNLFTTLTKNDFDIHFSPPLLVKNINLINQSFLI